MKKKLIIGLLFLMMLTFVGCSQIINFETTTTNETTQETTTTEITEQEIDLSQLREDVYSDVYSRIYNELYLNIRADVIEDVSDEQLDIIYNQVKTDILEKIETGEITLEAKSIYDSIINVGQTSAQAVVGVSSLDSSDEVLGVGSGVIYKRLDNTYYVVTNYHVVEGAQTIQIQMEDEVVYTASLRGFEDLVDLAVLYFESEADFTVANFGDSDQTKKGEFILAVGNPSGYDYYNTLTMGIVSGINRYFDIDQDGTRDMFVNYIQHDAAINAGNSGGALFNLNGEIIGINVLKLVDFDIEGMGFAIPSSLVELIVGDIEEFGFSRRKPVLGITFIDISQNRDVLISEGYEIPEDVYRGFYIQDIVPDSTVDGHIFPDDIVIQIGEVEIVNTSDFVEEFSRYLVGDIIDIVVLRKVDGIWTEITLTDIELKGNTR
ncbi:MAG: trypsin-like peptidase domain-containing protein [Candidatus Izimaplasma sp.]|nr:trypsin-like peptidase domain-containing protein [Candidatus Izimaplasma bacterium]